MFSCLSRWYALVTLFGLSVFPVYAGSSNSLLDLSPAGDFLLVANADNASVTVVDTVGKKAVREIKVGDKPEGVAWIGPGPLAAVTVYKENSLVFFNAQTGDIVKKLLVAGEPYGIVTDKAGRHAWVTHEYPGLVSEVDLRELKVIRQIKAGPYVRGLALSPDEKRLYVTEFYTGILHAIDLASGQVVDSWKGHSTDNLSRNVVLHPRRPKAYLPHIRSMVRVNHGAGSIFPQVSICDLRPGPDQRRSSIAMDSYNGSQVVTNPWEAAISADGQRIYTVYAATDDLNVSRIIDDDYKEMQAIGNAVRIGHNPRALRLSPDGKVVYVYNTMDFAVGIYTANLQLLETIPVCAPPKTPEWVRGKILFNTANPPMTARRWIACSSCHPDGHSDGRVWQQPEGLRKAPPFFGMAHTHPMHWSGDRDEVQDFEYTIRSRLMEGRGLFSGTIKPKRGHEKIELEAKLSGLSPDLDALAVYCNSFDFSLSPHIPAPGKLSSSAQRGKEIFFRKDVACADCHSGPYFTDSRLQKPFNLHDVGTGNDDLSEKMGPQYDTPTLLGVYRLGPYLHHGKAKDLHEVLTVYNKQDKHGKTSHLNKKEIDDLVEFLKSLPYETPPAVTPNTVEFRVIPGAKKKGN